MYAECREYLIAKLQAANAAKPKTTMKQLSLSKDSHVSAVLAGKDTFVRNGSKTIFIDDGGSRHKRRKVFDRNESFNVVIGDYSEDAVEATMEAFLNALDDGLYINGNFVPIEVDESEWVEKDDSILQSKLAVNMKVTFGGGVYRDTDFAKVTDVTVDAEKEDSDGSE